jgi:hypothetical protein
MPYKTKAQYRPLALNDLLKLSPDDILRKGDLHLLDLQTMRDLQIRRLKENYLGWFS